MHNIFTSIELGTAVDGFVLTANLILQLTCVIYHLCMSLHVARLALTYFQVTVPTHKCARKYQHRSQTNVVIATHQ